MALTEKQKMRKALHANPIAAIRCYTTGGAGLVNAEHLAA